MSVRKSSDKPLRGHRSEASLKTWIEIDSRAARHNYKLFRKIIGPNVKLWAVVKSNAYGHGLLTFSKLADRLGVDGFCVDSVIEGEHLRNEGIKKFILVLGPTLPALLPRAAARGVTVNVSNIESLKAIANTKNPPAFHLKIDTGMHRQGFYVEELPKLIPKLTRLKEKFTGIFTHFASAKDINYPTYTEGQFRKFLKALTILKRAGFDTAKLVKHTAATGATLTDKKYHLDAVRVGIGLYGLYPSKELEIQLPRVHLRPVLSWRTVISELKFLKPGDYVGYDLVERVNRPTKAAVLPVGYWHGLPRALSSVGEVLVSGRRAKILGRISMDLTVADVTGIRGAVGDAVTLIGADGREELAAEDAARRAGTISYELLTRLNPLIERIVL